MVRKKDIVDGSLLLDRAGGVSANALENVDFSTEIATLADLSAASSATPLVTQSAATTVTIDPYKIYNFGTVSINMTVEFNTQLEKSGYAAEYSIQFVAGDGCSITLPYGVLYSNGQPMNYTLGRTYEINIVNNCAATAEFY